MNEIKAELVKARPNIRDSTRENYLLNLRKLHEGMEGDKNLTDLNFLLDKKKLDEYLSKCKTDNTCKNTINVVIVFLMILLKQDDTNKKIPKLLEDLTARRDDLNKKYTENLKTNKKSDKQEKNWLSVEEIDNIANALKAKDYQAYAVIKFHLEIPLRNDLASVKVMTKSAYVKLSNEQQKQTNAIIKSPNNYVLKMNNYKTSGSYKEKTIDIDPKLYPIIRKLIALNQGKEYLLINPKTDNRFTPNEYTRFLNRIFHHTGKKVSSTLLRNIVVSHKYGDIVKEMKATASDMLHSSATQQGYIKTN
jgi:hypothetical protein